MDFSYSNKHHGQSKSNGDDRSVGTEGGTITGMAVANTAEAQSHYNTATSWHTQLGAVRKVYLTVLGCSKDGLCLCLKVKRRKETRRNFRSDIENENGSMQMVSKLDMPLPVFLGLGACSLPLAGHPAVQQTQTQLFQSPFLYSRECVKVKANTTCKSSISQVSLKTHPGA